MSEININFDFDDLEEENQQLEEMPVVEDHPYDDFEEEEAYPDPQDMERTRSLLAIDVGTVNTRALLFDAVQGRYRFIAAGQALTTAGAPMYDASEGVSYSLDMLERISGRIMRTADEQVLVPSTSDGSGADNLATTVSTGEPLKVVVTGLLSQVSLTSAVNLVHSTYAEVLATISLENRRSLDAQLNTIIKTRPDVLVVAGGTDGGANRSVMHTVNSLGMALYLLPEDQRPSILYAGNAALGDRVQEFLGQFTKVHVAPNVRPALQVEHLGPAEIVLSDILRDIRIRKILGIGELNNWSNGNLQPTASAQGRIIRFLSKINRDPANRGVLGVDIGAASTAIAAGFNGDLRVRVVPKVGVGEGLQGILRGRRLEQITRWIPLDVSDEYVLNYIQNKSVFPTTLPAEREDLAIEQALAREAIRMALEKAHERFPRNASRLEGASLPAFDTLLVGGAVVANAPTLAQSLLMILDSIEPTGVVQTILDKNNLAPALGAAAPVNPTLVTQLLGDPVAFLNLGYVIAPVGNARAGSPLLRIRIVYDTGHENVIEVAAGVLQTIPLPRGRRATLYIDPFQRADVGSGPGRSLVEKVVGGPYGVIVDARGRPLQVPMEPNRRREALRNWHFAFGR